jgi:hypothetical protein
MSSRTALIISCSQFEADTTREKAELQRRTMSAYMLHNVMRQVLVDETLSRTGQKLAPRLSILAQPRTTMLIRCSIEEAARIRTAAKRRDSTISAFVLHSLRSSSLVAEGFGVVRKPREFKIGDTIKANLPMGVIVTAKVRSIISGESGVRLEVEDAQHRIELIYPWQVVDVA